MYAPPPPKESGFPIWVIIVIVVVVVIGAVAAIAVITAGEVVHSLSQLGVVQVSAINITSRDNACGLNGRSLLAGFLSGPDASFSDTLNITSSNSSSCTIHSVAAVTAGFGLSDANVPLTIPGDGSQNLSFTITTPNSFDGVLILDVE